MPADLFVVGVLVVTVELSEPEWPPEGIVFDGASPRVLLSVYAKCLSGQEAAARRLAEDAFKAEPKPGDDADGEEP